ncbi:MAG: TIGR04283 family arsenosugar biosynthesis glycosyltransferase [Bryobacteraceae bacterium]
MKCSIIIPTLNEAKVLPGMLRAVSELQGDYEVIVADGGSADNTVAIAESLGAAVVHAQRGRGSQQIAGAARATGDVLWFLHADSTPSPDSLLAMEALLSNTQQVGGNFTLHFDGHGRSARALTLAYPYFRLLGLCYGDSGIFVRRTAYESAGGFQAYPLFEDIDFVRRLRRNGQFSRLPCRLITSSRRFDGRFLRTFAHWTLLQILYWLGVSPVRLARFYAHIR